MRSIASVTAPDSIWERSVRSETSASISEDCRSRMFMSRARSGGRSVSPASVSTAARIAEIGVLSSWDTSETKRRRIDSVRSRSVTSRTTPTAAGSPAAVPCGTARTLTSSTCSGEVSPPRRRTAASSVDGLAPDAGLEEP